MLAPLPRTSLAAGAYDVLVRAIVSGALAPGARIRDAELARAAPDQPHAGAGGAQAILAVCRRRDAHTAAELVEAHYLRLGEQITAILEHDA